MVSSSQFPTFKESVKFTKDYSYPANVSLSTGISQVAEIKKGSKKTDPNVQITGANEDYLILQGIDIEEGRNFSLLEIQYGSNVAIIGPSVKKKLYNDNESPINDEIIILGHKFRIIGVMEEKGPYG